MIRTIEIDGEKMVAVVLGDAWSVDINDYRRAIFNMFEMAVLFKEFDQCIEEGQMWTILRFIKALGLPKEEKKGGKS